MSPSTTAKARESHIFEIFDEIEKWLADKTKYGAVDILRKFEVPCAPVLSMKEIAYDPALRASGSVVEVNHKERGSYLTVGCPVKFSDFTPEITGSPLLGAHRRRPGRARLRRRRHRQNAHGPGRLTGLACGGPVESPRGCCS